MDVFVRLEQIGRSNRIVIEAEEEISAGVTDGAAARGTGAGVYLTEILECESRVETFAESFGGIGRTVVDSDHFEIAGAEGLLLESLQTLLQDWLAVAGGNGYREKWTSSEMIR